MGLSGKWYLETVFPDLTVMLQVREVLHSGHTAYQQVEVLESEIFGRSLVLDGKTQSTERDEFVYHEALVHPALLVVGESFHHFSPQGVTGILAIAESHISIHTWPEYGYAAADIFACGSSFEPKEAAELLAEQLESKDPDITEIQRGMVPTTAVS